MKAWSQGLPGHLQSPNNAHHMKNISLTSRGDHSFFPQDNRFPALQINASNENLTQRTQENSSKRRNHSRSIPLSSGRTLVAMNEFSLFQPRSEHNELKELSILESKVNMEIKTIDDYKVAHQSINKSAFGHHNKSKSSSLASSPFQRTIHSSKTATPQSTFFVNMKEISKIISDINLPILSNEVKKKARTLPPQKLMLPFSPGSTAQTTFDATRMGSMTCRVEARENMFFSKRRVENKVNFGDCIKPIVDEKNKQLFKNAKMILKKYRAVADKKGL